MYPFFPIYFLDAKIKASLHEKEGIYMAHCGIQPPEEVIQIEVLLGIWNIA